MPSSAEAPNLTLGPETENFVGPSPTSSSGPVSADTWVGTGAGGGPDVGAYDVRRASFTASWVHRSSPLLLLPVPFPITHLLWLRLTSVAAMQRHPAYRVTTAKLQLRCVDPADAAEVHDA